MALTRNQARGLAAAAVLVIVLIVSLGGDEEGSEENRVRDAVTSFIEAGNERDAARACELLTAEQVEVIEAAAGGVGCDQALGAAFEASGDRGDTEIEILEVRISEDNRATVDAVIRGEGERPITRSILLAEENGEWRIADPQF